MAGVSVEPVRGDVPVFVGLTVVASWLVWIPMALGMGGIEPSIARLVGAFVPSTVAVALSALAGRAVLAELLGRLRRWRVGLRWYAFALGFPALASLLASGVAVVLGWPPPDFASPPAVDALSLPAGMDPWLVLPVVFFQSLLLGSAMGEEFGWRGYLLPRLQARVDALRGGLLVGVVWGVWHLPLWLAPESDVALGPSMAGLLADAVLFAWLFNVTRGSLAPVLVFHAAIAVTGLYLATTGSGYVEPAVKWLVVALMVHRYGPARLGA
jgi:membrane protease YdiL (CAAX protease family)